MSDFSDLRKGLSKIETLEREIHLKQLLVNRLLTITQAINNNVSASGLYEMYNSFLSWEMGVKKMALFIQKENIWTCTSSIGISEKFIKMDVSDQLSKYQRLRNLSEDEHPLIKEFDIVIPVLHKNSPIAYAFIGGFSEEEDMYNKVQFITTITNIIAVAIENKRLFKHQIEQERTNREMQLASDMQSMLIPSTLPKGDCYELASVYKPHLGVGGDYFDFIEFEDDKFAFCIADISGKGVAAALLMANFQANFHVLVHKRLPLDQFVEELNQSLFRITKGEKFLTFFIAEFDKKTNKLYYVNAGHNPPVLVIEGKSILLDRGCTILGSFEELPYVQVGEIELKDEAIILTFTDGLTDIKNDQDKYFSEDILRIFVEKNYKLPAAQFNNLLMERIEVFKGKQTYPDDITVLTCKIFKHKECDL